jgi:hypothetical protein
LRLAVGAYAAKDLDLATFAFGEKQVAVGREAQQARIVEVGGIHVNLEALGRDGPRVGGARDNVGAVIDGLVGGRRRQIADRDVAASARRFVKRVSECRLAGEDRVIRRIGSEGGEARQKKQSGERSVDAEGKVHETSH